MNKRRVTLIITAGVLIGITVIFYTLWLRPVLDRTMFAQDEWLQGNARTRGKMVHDLISRKIPDGKTKSEVIALLGMPADISSGSVSYVVDIGHKFDSHPWTYRLCIWLDDSNRVKSYSLHD